MKLVKEVIDVARSKGAFRLIAFTAVGNERLLKRMGVNTRRISAPRLIDNKSVVPFWIEIDDETTSALSLTRRLTVIQLHRYGQGELVAKSQVLHDPGDDVW
ncbi:hypothetical protein [Pseudomonas sp. Q12-87]|uniref:hypothetical protein n=1 Tax=Pseudomonas sp. Q12-87 TaxID=177989 RepID=UPI00069DAA92|nr:hypothetical protein [Pseudomonas sp. Q12-87]